MMASITRNAPPKPIAGLMIIGMTTLSVTLSQSTVTPAATPTPIRPPINACDDDDGMPKYHVMRFQVIAPMRALMTTVNACSEVMSSKPTRISLMVLATPTPNSAPTKFRMAAMTSAIRGVSARVDTEVAMALAAS